MNINVLPYDFPDFKIFDDIIDGAFEIWQPDKTILVLGQSNKPEDSLFLERVKADNIPVTKRPSGGETVILTPNTIVISAVAINSTNLHPRFFFSLYNNTISKALLNLGMTGITQKGISDLAIGEKKILGSSIYRRKEKVFYHAVLNHSESIDIIGKYIQHPAREPDYRQGRQHKDFVTSLLDEGFIYSIEETIRGLQKVFIGDD